MLARVFLCLLLLVGGAEARCYDAEVASVYDGDTFTANVGLGFDMSWNDRRVRILEIDAPEIRPLISREEATRVRDILAEKINGQMINICTGDRELDAFGRILAYVYYDGINIGQWLLDEGLVVPYD